MKTIIVERYEIAENPQNPRTITEEKMQLLIQSLLDFPEMLFIRPIVKGSKGLSLGGNMRFKAINEIREYTHPFKIDLLEEQKAKREGQNEQQRGEFEEAINHLLFDKNYHVIDVSFLSEEKQDEFIIKDNIGYGEWDWPVLTSLWEKQGLASWGLEVPKWVDEKADQNKEKEVSPEDLETTHVCPKCSYEF